MSNRFVVTREKASKFEVTVDGNKNPDYNRKWEQKFKWLRPSGKGSDHFYCKVCKKDSFGSLRHITLHCTSKAHMKALVNSSPEPSSASVYFVEKPQEAPKKPPMRKRRISDQSNDRSDSETMEISPSNTKPPPPKSELIHLKTYTCPSDGRKIVFNMERRLEPLKRADTSIRVKRQVVPPFTRTSETQAAVNAIQQAEAGLLIEEEPAEPFAASPVHPIIKSERVTPKNPSPNTPSRVVIDQRVDEDTFDVFSRHVANKLRSLSVEQNRFAQKLIMDVLFEGEMESLDRNTKVLKCGVSCVCQH